jgi:hypothetical protein
MKITHSAKIMKPLLMLNTMVYVTTNTGICQNSDGNSEAGNGLYKKCISFLSEYPSFGSEQKERMGLCSIVGKLMVISSLTKQQLYGTRERTFKMVMFTNEKFVY